MRAMNRTGRALFGEDFSFHGIDFGGNLDPLIFRSATDMHGIAFDEAVHSRFRNDYARHLQEELQTAAADLIILPGVKQLIHTLRTHPEITLGLLTGNYHTTGPIKLMAIGIEPAWFEITAYGDEAADRPALVALAIDRFRVLCGEPVSPADIVVIGDTPRDIACAHANQCRCVAVATGHHDVDSLAEAGADAVLNDLSETDAVLSILLENR